MTALLLFVNILEEAIETGEVVYTCSRDITQECDSVSKAVYNWADWLAQQDEEDNTVVRTSHGLKI